MLSSTTLKELFFALKPFTEGAHNICGPEIGSDYFPWTRLQTSRWGLLFLLWLDLRALQKACTNVR